MHGTPAAQAKVINPGWLEKLPTLFTYISVIGGERVKCNIHDSLSWNIDYGKKGLNIKNKRNGKTQ